MGGFRYLGAETRKGGHWDSWLNHKAWRCVYECVCGRGGGGEGRGGGGRSLAAEEGFNLLQSAASFP